MVDKKPTHNNVYMKRCVIGINSKSMVTTEDKVTAYETLPYVSHASYTLDRCRAFINKMKLLSLLRTIAKWI